MTPKQQLLSKYVCLADTEERRMLIQLAAEKGGVTVSRAIYEHTSASYFDGLDAVSNCAVDSEVGKNRELIDTTKFCQYLMMSEEECEKVLNEGRRVRMTMGNVKWNDDVTANSSDGYSFQAFNAKGEHIRTNEPIKSIELWKD